MICYKNRKRDLKVPAFDGGQVRPEFRVAPANIALLKPTELRLNS